MAIMKYKGQTYGGSSTDVSENDIVYESADELNPESVSEMSLLENQETTKTFAQKVSTAVKNIRYLLKMLGNTDISAIGDGTVTGAVDTLSTDMDTKITKAIWISDGKDLDDYKEPGLYAGNSTAHVNSPVNGNSFTLQVMRCGDHILQIFITYQLERGKYLRGYSANSNDWDPWMPLVTQIKGNAETEYRGGLVNLTPANIGAVDKNGDDVPGRLVLQKGYNVWNGSGKSGTGGYIIFAELKIENSYINHSIILGIGGRGYTLTIVSVHFGSVGNNDPDLNVDKTYKYGDATVPIYIRKTAASTWQLCSPKNEAYGRIEILFIHGRLLGSDVKLSYPGTQINSADFVLSDWTDIPYGGVIGKALSATVADKLTEFRATHKTEISNDEDMNAIGYVRNMNSVLGQNDGALYKQTYDSAWIHEIYGDYRTGQIAVRGKNSGTWQAWRKILDHLNFRTHIPEATASASGLMSAADKTNLGNAVLTQKVAASVVNGTNNPTRVYNVENDSVGIDEGKYFTVLNVGSYSAGNFRSQMAFPYQDSNSDSNVYVRTAKGAAWRAWRKLIHSGNIASYLPSVGNGTVTIKQAGATKGTFTTNQSGNTTIELTDNNTTYGVATQSANGLMSAADKAKLDGVAANANKYTFPYWSAVISAAAELASGKSTTVNIGSGIREILVIVSTSVSNSRPYEGVSYVIPVQNGSVFMCSDFQSAARIQVTFLAVSSLKIYNSGIATGYFTLFCRS